MWILFNGGYWCKSCARCVYLAYWWRYRLDAVTPPQLRRAIPRVPAIAERREGLSRARLTPAEPLDQGRRGSVVGIAREV